MAIDTAKAQAEAERQKQLQAARDIAAMAERRRVAGLGITRPQAVTATAPADTKPSPELLANHIRLPNGEWVSKDAFYRLSEDDQNRLMQLGTRGFNNYYAQKEAEFRANNVQLRDGSWVSKELYDSLGSDDRKLLQDVGIEEFNRRKQAEYDVFKAQNVQLKTGEWIARADYDRLPAEWQHILSSMGTEKFQSWLKTAYGGATSYFIIDGKVYGDTRTIPNYPFPYDPNIALDAGGNRIWIGGRWSQSVTRTSTGAETLSSRWPASVRTFNPISMPEVKGITAVYTGLPTSLGGTWGMTPETLAVQKMGGNVIKFEGATEIMAQKLVERAVRQLSPADRARYESELQAIQGIPKDTIEAKLAYRQQERILEANLAQEIREYQGKNLELVIARLDDKPVLAVQLKNGELILKDDFDKLDKHYRALVVKRGISGLDMTEQFQYLKQIKAIPGDAVYLGIDNGGNIMFEIPDKRSIMQKFKDMIAEGIIPAGSKFLGVTADNEIEYEEPDNRTALEKFKDLQESGQIPRNAVFVRQTEDGAIEYQIGGKPRKEITAGQELNIWQQIWRALTPWAEEGGENFKTYIKTLPKKIINYPKEWHTRQVAEANVTQEQLKAEYDAYQDSPWWFKMITGAPVVKHSDGSYYRVIQGCAPGIGSAGNIQGITKGLRAARPFIKRTLTISAEDIGMEPAQYNRFIQARILNPKLTPEQFKADELRELVRQFSPKAKEIASKSIDELMKHTMPKKVAPSIVSKVAKTEVRVIKPLCKPLTVKPLRVIKSEGQAIQIQKGLGKPVTITKATSESRVIRPTKVKPPIEVTKFVGKPLTVKTLVTTGLLTPNIANKVLGQVLQANAITNAISLYPNIMSKIMEVASPKLATRALEQLDSRTKTALLTRTLQEAKVQAQTALQTQTKAQILTKTQAITATMQQTETLTKAQLESVTGVLTQQETQAKPATKTQTQTKEREKTAQRVGTIIRPTTFTPSKTQSRTPTKPTIGRHTPATRRSRKRVPPVIKILQDGSQLQLKLTKDQIDGIVAWKQGIMYWLKYPDKNGRYPVENTIHTREPIEGVHYHTGIGSVARSIIKKYGEIPRELRFDMGIQDVRIYRDPQPGVQKPKISFKLDPKHRGARKTTPMLSGVK